MARKSKIEFGWDTDYQDRSFLRVTRKTGKLTWSEVLEMLTDSRDFNGQTFVLELPVTGELPFDLYDEGDVWFLYQTDEYFGKEGSGRLRPRKVVDISGSGAYRHGRCSTCNSEVKTDGREFLYCHDCGQELYWD